ncbi:thiopurine S-methyltransferase [Dasania marina]|uniref:thiopurine S-methyltransferase n=1 Tax=Dasania marina TaxID=471499 RepID=UPI0030D703C3|tara:strand:- start:24218 stop:24856 length:639 start_codon:yes stop_codon:yes gene_type:complete
MDANFWHQKWQNNEIGFHLAEANPLLLKHIEQLQLAAGSRVFLPLCGKTRDIAWLLANGLHVVGSELSELAVQQLFEDLAITAKVTGHGNLKHYQGKNIELWVGDIFTLTKQQLGPVDAIYDRAALVALPLDVRKRYSAHLTTITNTAAQLLICFQYDQQLVAGPPFSISDEEVQQHYEEKYNVALLEKVAVDGGLKGLCPATESVFLLSRC